jgi:hypothetical protein
MTTYTIYAEGGQELSGGISSELVARRVAQEFANDLVETVYLDTAPSSTDPDDDTDVGEAIEPEADAILRHYGVTMTTGSEGESVSEQALTREAARACVAALTAAGIEASEAPDHDDRSMSWVYVGGAIEPDITADTITDRQIWALRDEAAAAGEHRAELRALGIIPEHIDADVRARADCARVIAQARHND